MLTVTAETPSSRGAASSCDPEKAKVLLNGHGKETT
jgi:hypothetical protein